MPTLQLVVTISSPDAELSLEAPVTFRSEPETKEASLCCGGLCCT